MQAQIAEDISRAVDGLFGIKLQPELTRPDEQFGDFSTNAALQVAGQLGRPPREVAGELAAELGSRLGDKAAEVSVAGPGFINLRLSDQALLKLAAASPADHLNGQTIVIEYSDPNPFKILHAGHLYTSVVGDAIANLLETAGGEVHRVNFGGDVGLHVGKTMWAILKELGGENPDKLADIAEDQRSEWLAAAYIAGTKAYEEEPAAKAAIIELNKRVYQLHADGDRQSPFAQIYWTTRQWSYDYFDEFYRRIGSRFEKYYPESETAEIGLETVKKQIGKTFEESDGAVVFRGEKHGLHTRVFINSEGLPTYETKDVGLIMAKKRDYNFDKSVVITGNEQEQYMAVVLKAIEQFAPELARASTHLTHGIVKLKGGVKMSSRKGNILRAADVLDAAADANRQLVGNDDERVVLGAVKYAFLKVRTGGDIIYDPAESVSLQGNSGPYLQYAHARARSILAKAGAAEPIPAGAELEPAERSLVRKLGEYAEVVEQASRELTPHQICAYLYELAQIFNRFYEHNRVIGDPRQAIRLTLVGTYADVLKHGLRLLNIPAPERL